MGSISSVIALNTWCKGPSPFLWLKFDVEPLYRALYKLRSSNPEDFERDLIDALNIASDVNHKLLIADRTYSDNPVFQLADRFYLQCATFTRYLCVTSRARNSRYVREYWSFISEPWEQFLYAL